MDKIKSSPKYMLATGYILFETEKWKVNEWKKDTLCKSKHEDWVLYQEYTE